VAKLSDLIVVMTRLTGLPEKTVREVARRVREAGFIQTGKPGRYGGAEMTAQDAAALLLGLVGGSDVLDAGKTVALCWDLTISHYENALGDQIPAPPAEHYVGLGEGHSLPNAIVNMLWASAHDLLGHPEINFPYTIIIFSIERPVPEAKIKISCAGEYLWTAVYRHPLSNAVPKTVTREELDSHYLKAFGVKPAFLWETRSVNEDVFYELGDFLADAPDPPMYVGGPPDAQPSPPTEGGRVVDTS
jgi:hypothetical protein